MTSSGAAGPDSLTRTGVTMGTPSCMSPEQAKGEPADHRSDIFSFGIILYEIACGKRPFDGEDTPEILYGIVHRDPPPADQINPLVPRSLAALIERCLRKNKEDRAQSMAEIRTELQAVMPLIERRDAAAAKPKLARRTAAAGALLTLSVAGGGMWLWSKHAPERSGPGNERVLKYSIEVQKPGGAPYVASTNDTFHAGERFRLRVESPQAGFLYVIDEGPGANGAKRFWILYPFGSTSAGFDAKRPLLTDWSVFDENPGTERLWLTFAERPVETLQEALGSSDKGEVKDNGEAVKIGEFLSGLGQPSRTVVAGSGVQLRAAGAVLGGSVELRHQ
jgi:hypothetical protein